MTRAEKVARAQELRAEGLSYRVVGDRLGVTGGAIWKWLHPEATREINRRNNTSQAERKRAWERDPANKVPCPKCGGPTGHTRGQGDAHQCRTCLDAEVAEFRQAIIDGYRAGVPAWRIAEQIGRPENTVKSEAHRLRLKGIDLPHGATGAPAHRSAA